MSNDLLEAARTSSDGDSSEERYEKLKNEERDRQTAAEKRYEELKEEAKQEFIEKHEEREKTVEEEKEDGFVTH